MTVLTVPTVPTMSIEQYPQQEKDPLLALDNRLLECLAQKEPPPPASRRGRYVPYMCLVRDAGGAAAAYDIQRRIVL